MQCAGAHPRQSGILLLESRDVGAIGGVRDSSWRANSRNRIRNWKWRWRRRADVEHFYAHLHEVLNEIDFEDRTGHLMERLRRLFNRAQLDRNELNILRGILSAVQGRRGQSAQRSRK